ncbi:MULTISPECIES: hypothetical protein [unclassified Desulfovibrio]|uniref:hypothetical protein n=1 Tax=unclassified Desulfovibrio TaxID=2593640 RepID=UPI0013E9CD5C|nr:MULTISPECIES: hypothetical protein [unclassified Desulfovibrio]
MNGERGQRRRVRSLAGAMGLLLVCALLAACAGQGVEVRPRGQAVISVGTGSR